MNNMPVFTYTGEDKEGKSVTNTVTATDRFDVYTLAREQGHTVANIEGSSKFSLKKYLIKSYVES